MIRFKLDEEDFLRLCAGRTIRKNGCEFFLEDIGFDNMAATLDIAQQGHPDIPCDEDCKRDRGHTGGCLV